MIGITDGIEVININAVVDKCQGNSVPVFMLMTTIITVCVALRGRCRSVARVSTLTSL